MGGLQAAVHHTTASGRGAGARPNASTRARRCGCSEHGDGATSVRTVAAGQPADLCVLSAAPEDYRLRDLDAKLVAATVIDSEVISPSGAGMMEAGSASAQSSRGPAR